MTRQGVGFHDWLHTGRSRGPVLTPCSSPGPAGPGARRGLAPASCGLDTALCARLRDKLPRAIYPPPRSTPNLHAWALSKPTSSPCALKATPDQRPPRGCGLARPAEVALKQAIRLPRSPSSRQHGSRAPLSSRQHGFRGRCPAGNTASERPSPPCLAPAPWLPWRQALGERRAPDTPPLSSSAQLAAQAGMPRYADALCMTRACTLEPAAHAPAAD